MWRAGKGKQSEKDVAVATKKTVKSARRSIGMLYFPKGRVKRKINKNI